MYKKVEIKVDWLISADTDLVEAIHRVFLENSSDFTAPQRVAEKYLYQAYEKYGGDVQGALMYLRLADFSELLTVEVIEQAGYVLTLDEAFDFWVVEKA